MLGNCFLWNYLVHLCGPNQVWKSGLYCPLSRFSKLLSWRSRLGVKASRQMCGHVTFATPGYVFYSKYRTCCYYSDTSTHDNITKPSGGSRTSAHWGKTNCGPPFWELIKIEKKTKYIYLIELLNESLFFTYINIWFFPPMIWASYLTVDDF